MQKQEIEAKKAIEQSLEKEKAEAEIVRKGGVLDVPTVSELDKLPSDLIAASKRCYICKKTGHTKGECPDKPCRFCGKPGHLQVECTLWKEEKERQMIEEKKRKMQRWKEKKKERRREDAIHKLRVATGVHGFQALYEVLGLPPKKLASQAELKKAYQRMSLMWHPDKWANKTEDEKARAESKYLEIRSAYDLLLEGMERGNLEGMAIFSAGDILNRI